MTSDRFDTPGSGTPPKRGIPFSGRLLFGAVVLTLGLAWTADNLGFLDADSILRYWPALVMLVGVARLTGLAGPRHTMSGVLFTLFGAWMLANELGYIRISVFNLWPVLLIAAGGILVWKSMRHETAKEVPEEASYPKPFALMGAVSRGVESQDLVGIEVSAMMGGVELDLRGAKARGREVVVEAFAMWGGIELIVPDDWLVACEASAVMGGIEDQTKLAVSEPTTKLIVRGLVIMAGMEITNKPGSDSSRKGRVFVKQFGGSKGDPSGSAHITVEYGKKSEG
jgi:hypothetical protein